MNRQLRKIKTKTVYRTPQRASSPEQEIFANAVRHHQAGRMDEAATCYREAIEIRFDIPEAHCNLGGLLGGRGQQEEATVCFKNAVELRPGYADAHYNLGVALQALGRREDAVACYRRAIELDPDYTNAHYNLGILLGEKKLVGEAIASFEKAIALQPASPDPYYELGKELQKDGRLNEAVACFRKAIDLRPDFAYAHSNLGAALLTKGLLDDAAACFRKAIAIKPDYPDAHSNLGALLQEQGLLDEAAACCRRAIGLKPDYVAAYGNLGGVLKKQGRLNEAVACYRKAIELGPSDPGAHSNLGVAVQEQGRLSEAVMFYRRAIELDPHYPNAYNNLGVAVQEQGQLDEAVTRYRRAIELKPDYPEAHRNLGVALQEQGRLDEAVACFREAIDVKPDFPGGHCNLAMALLARGEMEEGWQEYEWRWKTPEMINQRRTFPQLQWQGEAAQGRTLLIHAEQGYGDAMHFCRYGKLAAERGLRVIMEVPKPLIRLLRGLPGVELVVAQGEDLPPFDLHCPMLSMPLAFGTTLETIPGLSPYLFADEALVAVWRKRLAATAKQGPRIGLAWAGNIELKTDCRRSMTPEQLAPLLELPKLHFISLQKGRLATPEDFPLTDFMDEIGDFADTAALIANLDLVISVDTAVVHLAAALGKPVWMLDRFDPDWRWIVGRLDSPWYPTLRIYRQRHPGEWAPIVANVANDLRDLFPCTTDPEPHDPLGGQLLSPMRCYLNKERMNTAKVVACKICGAVALKSGAVDFNKNCEAQRGLMLPKSGIEVPYWRCGECGFVFTDAFDSWTPDDYKEKIYNADYSMVDPDYAVARPSGSARLIDELFSGSKTSLAILDYGGGNGLMADELRCRGFTSARTYDPFTECYAELPKSRFDLVCCFETLEHVPNPMTTIDRICSLVKPGGMVLFSTLVQPETFDLDWWYLAPRNGHISLFSETALSIAWAKHGFQLFSWNKDLHAAFREVPDFAPAAIKNSMLFPVAAPARQATASADGFNEAAVCRSGVMLYNRHDQYVGASLRRYGECSIGETTLFGLIVQPGTTVLEIGANIGMHTVDLSRLVGPAGVVYAFEPQRLVFQTLCANLAMNSRPNVFTYQAAVGADFGTLLVPWLDPDANNNFGGLSLEGAQNGETVPVLTVDGLGLNACHLIKVDVEGMETDVLRGAAATIKRLRPMLYVENDRESHSAELIALVQSYGYRLYWHLPPLYNPENFRGDRENIFGNIVSVNMLCIPAEVPQTLTMFREVTGPADTWH